jgi:tetratricopeptide (TPR) repeat protein
LSDIDFEKMERNSDHLLSFNNFLSTSIDRDVSFTFANSALDDPSLGLVGVIFRMDINPSKSSTPFASLKNINQYSNSEQEILFSMHTVIRIGEIDQIQDRLGEVHLILTDDDDPELRNLTDYIRLEIEAGFGWQTMGQLMTKMGEFDKAIEIYHTLLETIPNSSNEEMIRFLITNYNNVALAYDGKGDFSTALSYYEKILEIEEKVLPENHSSFAITYNNMATAHRSTGNYQVALTYLQKTVEI